MAVPSALRERGIALVTALLVVALATVAAAGMASRQQLDIRRAGNLTDFGQARAYAEGVEAWGRAILRRDRKEGEVDHPGEIWAQRMSPVAVEGGQIGGFIEDQQGRFNLNNLYAGGKPSEVDLERFRRLLALLELPPGLADRVLDWIDPDLEVRYPEGAEDGDYMLAVPGYRAANRPFVSPTELRLVKGVDAKAYAKLEPFITALPGYAPINVNTAPAVILQALAPDLSQSDAERLVADRGEKGYASVEDFLRHEVLAGQQIESAGLAVGSRYFLIRAEVFTGAARVRLFSLVERDADGVRTLLRSQGVW